jgi:amidase
MPAELMTTSAIEQAETVRSGEVSSRELVEESLAAIDRMNGEVNAVITLAAERALAEADRVEAGDERPLAGVPIVIKDLLQLTEGIRTAFGTEASGEFVSPFDTGLVAKLRAAGAIIVGKTNTPEFGILPTTEPHRFGATHNPWDLGRTPGGSSGGTAAAVASGMVAFGHGNDGGGSIRIPASCCGLVGLKPSRGRISLAPLPESAPMLATDGFLTRTVADTALGMDIGSGYEWGDSAWPPPPSAPFADAARRDPGTLRVGFTTVPPNEVEVHEDCVAAVQETAKLLESLGHEVEEAAPAWVNPAIIEMFLSIWVAEVGAGIEALGGLIGGPVDTSKIEPLSRELLEGARAMPSTEALNGILALRGFTRSVVGWWADHDVLLTPTLAQPPMPLGWLEPEPGEPAMKMLDTAGYFTPFTPPINATGQPAISLPLHESADGLPIGVQFVGPPAGEELLLSLAGQLETAAPWADRRPAMAAAGA